MALPPTTLASKIRDGCASLRTKRVSNVFAYLFVASVTVSCGGGAANDNFQSSTTPEQPRHVQNIHVNPAPVATKEAFAPSHTIEARKSASPFTYRQQKHSQKACIEIEWDKQNGNTAWFHLVNECDMPLLVKWCEQKGCSHSTKTKKLHPRERHESWVALANGAVDIFSACALPEDGELEAGFPASRECIVKINGAR